MKKSLIEFFKIQGAGNDFIVLDARKNPRLRSLSRASRKNLAIKLCHRRLGIGADGFIILEKPGQRSNSFRWDFYNNDGSLAEMCLNASRCVTLYETQKNPQRKIYFETSVGVVAGQRIKKNIKIALPPNLKRAKKIEFKLRGKKISGYFINTGVPHFVLPKKTESQEALRVLSKEIRNHSLFGKSGTNVTFWKPQKNKILAVTYERGVEDFTLACGTGAAAVAAIQAQYFKQKKSKIEMPGGVLTVVISDNRIIQTGAAEIICMGQMNLKGKR